MRRAMRLFASLCGLAMLAACASGTSAPTAGFPGTSPPQMLAAQAGQIPSQALPSAQGEIVGSGPVRIAIVLPLSGSSELARVGTAIRNGAILALETEAARGSATIHAVIKDSGGSASLAETLTRQAIGEGAALIIGPVQADAVAQAGQAARNANIPLIGFSNTASVAAPGNYLFSHLPEAEIMRSLGFAIRQGSRNAVALVPANPFGHAQAHGFSRAAMQLGLSNAQVIEFADEAAARRAIETIVPQIRTGQIDTLFLPDRATAPSFATLLQAGDIAPGRLTILGSSSWQGDGAIGSTSYFEGALFAAPDPAGLSQLAPSYRTRFGIDPTGFSALGYQLALLANAPELSNAAPRFSVDVLTRGSGFSSPGGQFRIHRDGRSEFSLVVYRLRGGSAQIADGAGLGGLPSQPFGSSGNDAGIPAAREYQ